ncbi:7-cyano-7-deazaguanine synthase [Fluviicola sp.]|uniref:7-cyano-7-deazaguanine synthase n=1 Tax=Fluviicola sp. TaxID=1917219 RepID=UPI0031DB3F7D
MVTQKNNVLILASGGIDSTACIQFYKDLGFEVELVFLNLGQPSHKNELNAVTKISEYYGCKLNILNVSGLNITKGFILGRNAALIFLALMSFSKSFGIIAIGIHSGTTYYDCGENFLNQVQSIIKEYSGDLVQVAAPFLTWNKKEIANYCSLEKVPIHLTYSCELGLDQPCNECLTCKDLRKIYEC